MPVNAERYAYYFRALGGDLTGWDHEDAPWPGFYRARFSKLEPWQPVAIWDGENGKVRAAVGQNEGPINPLVVWVTLGCWQHAVTEQQYRHAVEHGTWWDTLRAASTEPNAGMPVVDIRRAEPIGPPRRSQPQSPTQVRPVALGGTQRPTNKDE